LRSTHFYQRALDNGFTVPQIVAQVFLANIVLARLALIRARTHKLGSVGAAR
jgi:hypothetical protein